MKEPKNCIGLNIKYKRGSMSISQPGYIIKLAEKYGQVNCQSTKLPMQVKINLEKETKIPGEAELRNLLVYSRPDIACSVNMLSQLAQDPRRQHYNAALRIVKYLYSTKDTVL